MNLKNACWMALLLSYTLPSLARSPDVTEKRPPAPEIFKSDEWRVLIGQFVSHAQSREAPAHQLAGIFAIAHAQCVTKWRTKWKNRWEIQARTS